MFSPIIYSLDSERGLENERNTKRTILREVPRRVRREEDGTLTVGITDHAQEALGDIVFVETLMSAIRLPPAIKLVSWSQPSPRQIFTRLYRVRLSP